MTDETHETVILSEGETFVCPECGYNKFDLTLGGRHSGRIECANPDCGYPLSTGNGQQNT